MTVCRSLGCTTKKNLSEGYCKKCWSDYNKSSADVEEVTDIKQLHGEIADLRNQRFDFCDFGAHCATKFVDFFVCLL